jgi:hypothetical protein
MTTQLKGPLKRELTIGKAPYILTIAPDGFKLVPKGKRKGYEMSWSSLVSGEAALATALQASLGMHTPVEPARDKPARK